MSRSMIVVAVVAVISVVFACNGPTTVRTLFTVEGMHCESCSSAITDALEKVDGVMAASADHEAGSAEATYLSPKVTPERLAAEIEGLGYTVVAMSTIPVEG